MLSYYCVYDIMGGFVETMANVTNTFCTIYKDSELTHEVNYITTAVKFQDKWLFLKSEYPSGYMMISGMIKRSEAPELTVRRELYNKAGIVAGRVYEVATYSLSTGYGKVGKLGRTTSYGKLYYTECVCLGKLPQENSKKIELLDEIPADQLFLNPNACGPLMKKIKNWLASGEDEKQLPYAFEKLCGAVTYCNDGGVIKYILIKNLSGHIGFPKGHAENNESELDTATREVFEETGLKPHIYTKFRHSFGYAAPGEQLSNGRKPLLHKTAVYFVAGFPQSDIPNIKIQEEEVLNWWLVPYQEAIRLLNKNTDKRMLELANRWIEQNHKESST